MTSREYADLVQSQIVNDIQAEFEDDWSRRQIWDRGYRESRTPSSPSMLLELLSHQNFADMKYGLNPSFRFTVSRAIYKAMLKYLSNRYGVPYAVQPLPVEYMGVKLASDASGNPKAVVSWRETADPIEPTAAAKGFILYTRIDGGGFDNGRAISASRGEDGGYSFELPIEKGHLYSYRIAAFNDGGLSFPSETVSVGAAESSSRKVLVVNNFDRISGPAYIDLPSYGGFDNRLDSGVPDVRDIAYIGETYEFRRDAEYVSNSNPGFGASYDDYAGKVVAGNTGDYAAIHGKAIMEAGYSFYSCSNEAVDRYVEDAWAIDLICGKQVTVNESDFNCTEYQVFPVELQKTLSSFTERGGNVLISGSYIATDVWDRIYPHQADSCYIEDSRKFVRKVLGYKWVRNQASRSGRVEFIDGNDEENGIDISPLASQIWSYHNEINPDFYCVESPDAISPASSKTGGAFMRYSDTRLPAGVYFNGKGYKTVSIGFPIETLKNNKDINNIISKTLEFFCK